MSAPARLVMIRHGHTAANGGAGSRLSGWTDTALSDEGWRETRAVRERLAREGGFAAIYSSPLQRARALGALLADARVGPLHLDADLREIGCGIVDGMPADEVRERFPELWNGNERQDQDAFRWPGGESYREFRERCVRAVGRIAAAHPGERVAVVTHAGVVSQLVGAVRGTPPARWSDHRPGNASLTVLDWGPGTRRVVRFDDREHLQAGAPGRNPTPPPRGG